MERKRKKEGRKQTSFQFWFQHWSSWWDVQGPGGSAQAWLGYLFIDRFPPPRKITFLFLDKLVTMHSLFFQTFPEMVHKGFGGLGWPWFPPPAVHAHFSASFLHLHCTVSCSSLGIRIRKLVPENNCPTSAWPLFPATSHSFLPHVTINIPCLLL